MKQLASAIFIAAQLLHPAFFRSWAEGETKCEPERNDKILKSSLNNPEPLPQAQTSKTTVKLGATENSFSLGATESIIAWTRWHHIVGKAIKKQLSHAARFEFGTAKLSLQISKTGKITTQLISSTSPKMGAACLAAIQNLDGNSFLEFPEGSKRESVQFEFEYKRGFLLPINRYISDDIERLSD
jgi:hypothetical protein